MIVLAPLAFVALLGASLPLGYVIRRDGWPAFPAASLLLKPRTERGEAAPGPELEPERSAPPGPERLLLLLAAVVLPVLVLAYFHRNSGFTWDDIKNMRQAQVDGFSFRYLFTPTSGHWAPGHRFGDWVQQAFFGYNFAAAQAMLLGAFAVTLLLFHRIVAELFRPGKGPIVLTLLYGASYVHSGVIQWWASGLDRVPATLFSFLSILAYLRFYKTRSLLWLGTSLVAIPCGFLFYIKPVFVPVYLVLMRLLLLEPERPLGETVRAAVREWWVWLAYAVVTGIFLYNYVSKYPTNLNEDPTLKAFSEYLSVLWFKVVVPGFFGVFIPQVNISSQAVAIVATITQIAFVAGLVWTLWKFPGSWRAWVFFLVGFAANALSVGLTRVGYFSPKTIAYTIYFNLEIAYLFFLAMGAIFLRRRASRRAGPASRSEGRSGPASRSEGRSGPRFASPVYRPLLAVGLVAYLVLSASGTHQLNDYYVWTGARARVYTDNIAADLEQIRDAGRDPALVDGIVPETVVPLFLAPYNGLSEVVPLFDEEVAFDPEGRDLFMVTDEGNVRAVNRKVEFGGDVQRLVNSGSVDLAAVTQRPDERGVCFTTESVTGTVAFPLPTPIKGGDLYVEMRYSTDAYPSVALIPEPEGGIPEGEAKFRVLTLQRGRDRGGVFPLSQPSLQRMVLAIDAGADVCLSRLEIGRLVPQP